MSMNTETGKDKLLIDIDNLLKKIDHAEQHEEKKEPECKPCKYNVGIGLGINICNQLQIEGIDCNELRAFYVSGGEDKLDVRAKSVIDTLIEKVGLANESEKKKERGRDFSKQLKDLFDLRNLMGLDISEIKKTTTEALEVILPDANTQPEQSITELPDAEQ